VGENCATFGLRNGPHVNVRLQDVRLPLDHLIGKEGKGVRQAVTTLDYSRTLAAGISIGIARAAFDAALVFARDRTAFDQKVVNFQGIQWYFADMLAKIDAARLLVHEAAHALDGHEDIIPASAAKLLASEAATEVAARCVQICGAYGTMACPLGDSCATPRPMRSRKPSRSSRTPGPSGPGVRGRARSSNVCRIKERTPQSRSLSRPSGRLV
jgi:alkylation response protein AidB-like acyl-CoA dehydrogenase